MNNKKVFFYSLFLAALITLLSASGTEASSPLRISSNGRYLEKSDGTPFFWMGDTAWFLAIPNSSDRNLYLDNLVSNGFNGMWIDLNPYGFESAIGENPFLSDDTDTPNEAYWSKVDSILTAADNRGIYVGLFISWPYHLPYLNNSLSKIDTFGRWLGNRYGGRNNIVWVISGEYSADYGYCGGCIPSSVKNSFETMAQAIRAGGGNQLMTIHPGSTGSPLQDFGGSSWYDFVIYQSGLQPSSVYTAMANEYNATPIRPMMDGETKYEGSLLSGQRVGSDLMRRTAYWDLLSGSFGHVYGAQEITLFYVPGVSSYHEDSQNDWHQMLNIEGRTQMRHLRALAESKPMSGRTPDQSLVIAGNGSGIDHVQSMRGSDGSYAWIYIPTGGSVSIDMSKLNGSVSAKWYNPRDGSYSSIGTYPNSGTQSFDPPGSGPSNDQVLVLLALSQSAGKPCPLVR